MTCQKIKTFAISVLVIAVSLSQAALAQKANVAGSSDDLKDELDDIVVTARNREESLRDVPLAISAHSGEALERQGIDGIRDLAYITSGVTVRSLGSEYAQRPIFRGQGDLSAGVGDPNVSVFLDGVYIYNTSAISLELADVDRVEVVKGPVSALYGRNAAAGAINYVTKRPGDVLAMKGRASFGEDGYRTFTANVSGPLIPGKVSLGLGGYYARYDGSYKDAVNGARAGGYEKKDFQVKLLITPTDAITIFATYYHGNDSFAIAPTISTYGNCGIPQGGTAASPVALPVGTPGREFFVPFNRYCGELNFGNRAVEVPISAAEATGNRRTVDAFSNRVEFELPTVGTFTWLTGYNKIKSARFNDSTGGRRDGFNLPLIPTGTASQVLTATPATTQVRSFFGVGLDTAEFSQEMRLSSAQNQRFRWQVGGFYYALSALDYRPFSLIGTLPAGQSFGFVGRSGTGVSLTRAIGLDSVTSPTGVINYNNYQSSQTWTNQGSVFGAAELDIVDGLIASGELRQTWESKRFKPYGTTNFFGPTTNRPAADFSPTGSFSYLDYRGTIKYTPMPGFMTYASIATGTKSGGFNTTRAAVGFEQEQTFGPEKNKTYEIGAKLSTLGNRLQLNVAAFRIDSRGAQVFGNSDNPLNAALIVRNLASVRTYGFEGDFAVRPVDGVRLTVALGFADPKIGNDTFQLYSANPLAPVTNAVTCQLIPTCAPRLVRRPTAQNANPQFFNAANLGGNQTPGTSKWQLSTGVDFSGAFSTDLNWFARAEYRYEARQFLEVENYAWLPERHLVNLRAGLKTKQFSLTGFVENLTDNRTAEAGSYQLNLSDFSATNLTSFLPTGRLIGVTLGFDY